MFVKAIAIDPDFAGGYAGAAYVHVLRYGNPSPRGTPPGEELETAQGLAEKAVALDPTFGPAWASLSEVYARKGRHDDALRAIETAMEAAPNDSLRRATYGRLLGRVGRPEDGINEVERAMRMSPDSLHAVFPGRQATAPPASSTKPSPPLPNIASSLAVGSCRRRRPS